MPPSSSTFSPLRHPHFLSVWIAAFVSSVGGWMEMIGVQWAMTQATTNDAWIASDNPTAPLMMSLLAFAQLTPLLLLGLFGGVAADRLNRKHLLIITQCIRMAIAAALCTLALRGMLSPWWLLALGACDGAAMAFNIPAWQVLTPRLVPREDLAQAITLNGLQFNLARAVGPALAGLLLAQSDVWVLFLCNALSFLGVIIAVACTPATPVDPTSRNNHPLHDLREAWLATMRHKGTRHLTIVISIFSMLCTPVLRFMPLLIAGVYFPGISKDVQEKWYGWLLGCMGIGAVVGALTVKRVPSWYPRHHFVPVSILGCGLALYANALATNIIVAMCSIAIVGIFWMWSFNTAFSALQLIVDDSKRGRVLAIVNTIGFGTMPLGALAVGLIANVYDRGFASIFNIASSGSAASPTGVRLGLIVLSLLLVLCGLIWTTYRVPEVDGTPATRRPGLWAGLSAKHHKLSPR